MVIKKTRKKSTKNMNLSPKDYRKILKFYKLSIPKKVSNLRKKGDKIIAKKFCSCIKKVRKKFKKEGIAIGICTKSVITRKGIKRGSFNCKGKTSIDLYKGGSKRSTKKKTRKKRGGMTEEEKKQLMEKFKKFNTNVEGETAKLRASPVYLKEMKKKIEIPPEISGATGSRFLASPIAVPSFIKKDDKKKGGRKRSTKKNRRTRKKRGGHILVRKAIIEMLNKYFKHPETKWITMEARETCNSRGVVDCLSEGLINAEVPRDDYDNLSDEDKIKFFKVIEDCRPTTIQIPWNTQSGE